MELLYATLIFLIGLGVLVSGAEVFIHHSAQLGAKLGVSDVIVGITLVALGTSIQSNLKKRGSIFRCSMANKLQKTD